MQQIKQTLSTKIQLTCELVTRSSVRTQEISCDVRNTTDFSSFFPFFRGSGCSWVDQPMESNQQQALLCISTTDIKQHLPPRFFFCFFFSPLSIFLSVSPTEECSITKREHLEIDPRIGITISIIASSGDRAGALNKRQRHFTTGGANQERLRRVFCPTDHNHVKCYFGFPEVGRGSFFAGRGGGVWGANMFKTSPAMV